MAKNEAAVKGYALQMDYRAAWKYANVRQKIPSVHHISIHMIILGTKFYTHDSACYWLDTTKKEIFASSVERLTRRKHDDAPASFLLDIMPPGKVDVVAHSYSDFGERNYCQEHMTEYPSNQILREIQRQNPTLSLEELAALCNTGKHPLIPFAAAVQKQKMDDLKAGIPVSVANRRMAEAVINRLVEPDRKAPNMKVHMFDHHLCHAISAYYSSSFYPRPCAVVTIDGWGDCSAGKTYIFRSDYYQELGSSPSPAVNFGKGVDVVSLGIVYQQVTAVAGFHAGWDEGKVEALAAFGKPIPEVYKDLMDACVIDNNAIYVSPQRVKKFYDQEYLSNIANTHGGIKNLCATIQKFLEDVVVQYINALSLPDDIDSLCLVGGVTANVIMNLAIYERTKFKKIHVTPYMADDGTACGSAILAAKLYGEDVSWIPSRIMPYLGPSYTRDEVRAALQNRQSEITFADMGEDWQPTAAKELAEGRIIALFQGQAEFGPRALGNRSILANPTDPTFRQRINVSIKRRPPWQPFCPSVLESERTRFFENSFSHKHMAIAFRMKPEFAKQLPSAVHIDGTARPQFVSPEDNPAYYQLLEEFKKITGYGILINTSFNLHGRAMVMKPEHAIDDFLDCNLDALYIEGYRVERVKKTA